MSEIISACGIKCTDCAAYQATQTNDQPLREKVAVEWSTMYHAEIKPEHIQCDGCNTDSPVKFAHCMECEIRLCAVGRSFKTCAECGEYPCKQLEAFFTYVPSCRENLDALRK